LGITKGTVEDGLLHWRGSGASNAQTKKKREKRYFINCASGQKSEKSHNSPPAHLAEKVDDDKASGMTINT
jgi:hypothetical protein